MHNTNEIRVKSQNPDLQDLSLGINLRWKVGLAIQINLPPTSRKKRALQWASIFLSSSSSSSSSCHANGWHTSSVHLKFLDACRGSVPVLKTNDPSLYRVPIFISSEYSEYTDPMCHRFSVAFHGESHSRKIYRRSRLLDSNSIQWTRIDHNTYRYANFSVYRNRGRKGERECYVAVSANIRRANVKIESGRLEKRLTPRITRE